jgi:hypothetical protein
MEERKRKWTKGEALEVIRKHEKNIRLAAEEICEEMLPGKLLYLSYNRYCYLTKLLYETLLHPHHFIFIFTYLASLQKRKRAFEIL